MWITQQHADAQSQELALPRSNGVSESSFRHPVKQTMTAKARAVASEERLSLPKKYSKGNIISTTSKDLLQAKHRSHAYTRAHHTVLRLLQRLHRLPLYHIDSE